jgi:hypothetical protein
VRFTPATSSFTYSDSDGSIAGELANNGKLLLVRLGETVLMGFAFDSLQPEQMDSFPARFTLQHGFICNCQLDFVMPLLLKDSGTVVPGSLAVSLVLGKPDHRNAIDEESYSASLEFRQQRICTTGAARDFEDILSAIARQLPKGMFFLNCFGCQYADYSVYGNGTFGDMMCFRNVKASYNAVKTKLDYRKIHESFEQTVQEVYLCEEFEQRRPGSGYRG